jgi:hypothetical protein
MPGGYIGARPKDESKLSQKPSQIRNRLRRAGKRAAKTGDRKILDYELALYQEVTGFKPVEEWDLEELAHGKPRNAGGGFGGRVPAWITPDVTREAKRRLYTHAFGKLGTHADLAIQTIKNLLVDEQVDDKGKPLVDARTKLDAAKFIVEHILGKPKEVVEINATDNARQVLASAIVLDDGRQDSHLVLEGESWEQEEEDDQLGE